MLLALGVTLILSVLLGLHRPRLAHAPERSRDDQRASTDATLAAAKELHTIKAAFDDPGALDRLAYIEILDAWCFVYQSEPSWSLHREWRPWSAIYAVTRMDVKSVSIYLAEKTHLGEIAPNDTLPLKLGPGEKQTWKLVLPEVAAKRIRVAWNATKEGLWVTIHYHFSVRTERVSTTDAQGRRAITVGLRVQTEEKRDDGRKGEVSLFIERYEAEQKARRKVRNDRAALRRKAQVEAAQQRRSG